MTRRIILVDIGSGLVLSGVLPSVALFNDYSAKLSTRGGVVPYSYSIVGGELPDGLFIDAGTGIISGTTTAAGTATFTVRVTDLSGAFLDRQFSITVIAEPLMLSGHADNGTIDTAYSYTYTVSGGIPPYAWSIVAGALPSGVTLDAGTGELSGTPTAGGSFSWTVRVTDSLIATFDLPDSTTFAYSTLTLSGTYAAATVGVSYSSNLTISGGDGSYSNPHVTSGSLPAGLALSIVGSSLRLSGTPTAAATSAFTAAVDSGDSQTATSPQSIVISPNYAGEVTADAPLLWYRINGTAVNGATETNQGSFADPPSTPNCVYHLSATDQPLQPGASVVTGDTSSLKATVANTYLVGGGSSGSNIGPTTEYSVECWFTAGVSAGIQALVSLDNTTRTFQLRVNNNKLQLVHINGATVTITSSASVTGGTVHHAMGTLSSGGVLRLYLDGAQVATSTNAAMVATMKNNIFIANYNGSSNQLIGRISEVSVYGVGLSSTRVLAHYNAGK